MKIDPYGVVTMCCREKRGCPTVRVGDDPNYVVVTDDFGSSVKIKIEDANSLPCAVQMATDFASSR